MINKKGNFLTEHLENLKASYDEVVNKTWLCDDFSKDNLQTSRNLFEKQSLIKLDPLPKEVVVYALLSGLPFEDKFIDKLNKVQNDISKILKSSLHYWVQPQNLGIEYCVFKWPNGPWNNEWHSLIERAISDIKQSSFELIIRG